MLLESVSHTLEASDQLDQVGRHLLVNELFPVAFVVFHVLMVPVVIVIIYMYLFCFVFIAADFCFLMVFKHKIVMMLAFFHPLHAY